MPERAPLFVNRVGPHGGVGARDERELRIGQAHVRQKHRVVAVAARAIVRDHAVRAVPRACSRESE